jgi:TonB family protein
MKKEKKDKNFIKKPTYEGGNAALRKFITKNLRYPKSALASKIEGTVVIKFSISHNGEVVDARVISGLGHGCDEEALRIVRLLKFSVPKIRRVKVLYHKDIKINFRLPKAKAASTNITYTYQQKPREATPPPDAEPATPPQKGKSYYYTINF